MHHARRYQSSAALFFPIGEPTFRLNEKRRSESNRAVRTGNDADQKRKRKPMCRCRAEEEQYQERDEHGKRSVYRTHECLIECAARSVFEIFFAYSFFVDGK